MAAKSISPLVYQTIAKQLGLPDLPEGTEPVIRTSKWVPKRAGAPEEKVQRIRSTYWHIEDAIPNEDVYLLHYNSEALPLIMADTQFSQSEKDALLALRGLIVEGTTGRILCKSFGYTPTVTADQLQAEGVMELKDQIGATVHLNASEATYQICYEGAILRVWKYNGKVYMSTHRRINPIASRWGDSKTFIEQYRELGGPKPEELFGSQPTSNFCHLFLISHPDLLMCTKADVGAGWLVYLRSIELNVRGTDAGVEWDISWKPTLSVPQLEDVDGKAVVPLPPASFTDEEWDTYEADEVKAGIVVLPEQRAARRAPRLWAPTPFGGKHDKIHGQGLRLANTILSSGYSGLGEKELASIDYRVRPGEAVICIYDNGRRMMKIASRAYHWRMAIGGNNSNYLNRFFQLMDHSFVMETERRDPPIFDGTDRQYSYAQLFPYLGTPTADEFRALGNKLITSGPLWVPPPYYKMYPEAALYGEVKADAPNPRDLRLRNIALCFAMAVPIHREVDVTGYGKEPGYYQLLTTMRDQLITVMSRQFRDLEARLATTEPGKRLGDDINFGSGGTLNTAGKSVKRLVTQARSYAKTRLQSGNIRNARGKEMTDEFSVVLDNLRNLLMKEKGSTLYGLTRAFLKPRTIKPKEVAPEASTVLPVPSV